MGVFIGLDVSLSKTAVCVVDRDGAVLWQGKVPSEPGPLIARLGEWSGSIDLAGIEACPLSEWLHRGLREAGIPVVCIEVRHAQRFLSSWGIAVAKRRGMKRATVTVTRKLAVIMHRIWVSGGEFEFGSPAVAVTAFGGGALNAIGL